MPQIAVGITGTESTSMHGQPRMITELTLSVEMPLNDQLTTVADIKWLLI